MIKKEDWTKYFIGKNSKKECQKIFSEIIRIGIDFKTKKDSNCVVNYKEQDEIARDLLEPLPIKSKPLKEVIKEYKKKIVKGSVNFSSPHFLAFPDCGNSIAAMCGHISSGMLNQNLINSVHCSPTATFVEMTVINWLREIVGYKKVKNPKRIIDIGGINVPGGVLANTIGLLLAREDKFPRTIQKGLLYNPKNIKVFIPKGIGHYSIDAGLGWLGIGSENLIEVNTTPGFTIDQKDLKKR